MHHNIPPVDGPILQGNDLLLRPVAGRDYSGFYELLSTDRGRYVGGPLDEDFRIWNAFASLIGHGGRGG